MAITKKQKQHLIESYTQALEKAKNVVVLSQFALPVNVSNAVRQEVAEHGGSMIVARKRLLLLSLKKV
jgi:ribosomal protein L10